MILTDSFALGGNFWFAFGNCICILVAMFDYGCEETSMS